MDFRFIYLYHINAAERTKYKGIKKPYGFVLYNSVSNFCIPVTFFNFSNN